MPPAESSGDINLVKGPNIKPLPNFDVLNDTLEGPVLLKVGDNTSTDEILPAGTRVLPFRSNIPEISKFTFSQIDESYYERAMQHQKSGSLVVGGKNYGQGSSREHAALAPRYLGLRAVIVKSFARIHRQNLINFGILPLIFQIEADWEKIEQNDVLRLENLCNALKNGDVIEAVNQTKKQRYPLEHRLTKRQTESVLAGGLINVTRKNKKGSAA